MTGSNQVQIGTSVAHGAVVGDKVALTGLTSTPWVRSQNNVVSENFFYKLSTSNGKKYRCVKGGTTANVANPIFSTTDGAFIIDGTAVFMCDGPEAVSPYNGNHTVVDVPSAAFLRVPTAFITATNAGAGKITSLSKTYLSDFAPSGSRVASDALTGKSILAGGVLDCSDFTLDGGSVSREALVLVKTAALHADTDLADTSQRLVAYWDTMPGLPITPNLGVGTFSINNGADRLIRL